VHFVPKHPALWLSEEMVSLEHAKTFVGRFLGRGPFQNGRMPLAPARIAAPIPETAADLISSADECSARLTALKQLNPLAREGWYPYDSFGNIEPLSKLFAASDAPIHEILGNGPLLDLCCGDGDLSFFLENFGYAVHAVDWPTTNYNGMQGVRELKRRLGSRVEIAELDLNTQFELPLKHYRAAFFLGGLYHLKNPVLVMESLAAVCDYCVLSTRITRYSADRQTDLKHLPVAYLLSEGESNNDDTNYWIFSDRGLRVLCERTRWHVCAALSMGEVDASDPVTLQGDERAFYLLRSKVSDGAHRTARHEIDLLQGWHELEDGAWRWTQKQFALRAQIRSGHVRSLSLPIAIPSVTIHSLGAITLKCFRDHVLVEQCTYTAPGNYTFTVPLPDSLLTPGEAFLSFELDKCLPPDESDRRERGIIVNCDRLANLVR
jgi:SAM-dependent methyltransferase